MRSIERLLIQYGESHQNKANIIIHAIAVPSIYLVSIGLLWSLPVPDFIKHFEITWAHIIAIPVLYYYFMLSGPIGAAMTLLTIFCFGVINVLDYLNISVWLFSLVLFVVMWVLQFIGHHIEGKKPSFFDDLRFLLVGPAWWWVHWLKRMNISY
ncbi:DUF962 domain-containing protein [Alteromonas gracilis]|uniref:Mpo1 family 2-hydroxy fatty acid dioxygenase n=1 Tax=Alteromonas gracilis TaxID=1479524 RepID=UPI003735B9FA